MIHRESRSNVCACAASMLSQPNSLAPTSSVLTQQLETACTGYGKTVTHRLLATRRLRSITVGNMRFTFVCRIVVIVCSFGLSLGFNPQNAYDNLGDRLRYLEEMVTIHTDQLQTFKTVKHDVFSLAQTCSALQNFQNKETTRRKTLQEDITRLEAKLQQMTQKARKFEIKMLLARSHVKSLESKMKKFEDIRYDSSTSGINQVGEATAEDVGRSAYADDAILLFGAKDNQTSADLKLESSSSNADDENDTYGMDDGLNSTVSLGPKVKRRDLRDFLVNMSRNYDNAILAANLSIDDIKAEMHNWKNETDDVIVNDELFETTDDSLVEDLFDLVRGKLLGLINEKLANSTEDLLRRVKTLEYTSLTSDDVIRSLNELPIDDKNMSVIEKIDFLADSIISVNVSSFLEENLTTSHFDRLLNLITRHFAREQREKALPNRNDEDEEPNEIPIDKSIDAVEGRIFSSDSFTRRLSEKAGQAA